MTNDRRSLSDLPSLLRDARFMRRLSLRDAAKAIDISASTLSRMEDAGNPHVPDFDSLQRVAKWIGLEVCLLPSEGA